MSKDRPVLPVNPAELNVAYIGDLDVLDGLVNEDQGLLEREEETLVGLDRALDGSSGRRSLRGR